MMRIMSVRVDDPVRPGESRLPDGRLLGWAEWGPPDGVPVLLCPGAATSRWLGFGADVVDALGVRLVSVDRPGLGSSTPAPGRTEIGGAVLWTRAEPILRALLGRRPT
ncbi:hypothetical protein DER29_2923 [Micromonospora sp. M71_S20]|nr:hypothetical protein DER29_2923 [Micromonospora sp. M71_S20]